MSNDTLNDILIECARLRGCYPLMHRILDEFCWFCDAAISGFVSDDKKERRIYETFMFYLDIYDEENHIYTPYNFLDFCGFECHYNVITGMYDVNGFINGAVNIASFDDEEFAIAVTRSLYTFKAAAEIEPQPGVRPEARFINIDMIVEKLEKMEEDDEVLITEEITEEQHNRYDLLTVAFLTFWLGFITSMVIL